MCDIDLKTCETSKKFKKPDIVELAKKCGIDPYLIGYWLGDDSVICQDSEIQYYYGISAYKTILMELNLVNNKHIPDIYKYNSRENRLKLLAGLIDRNGNFHSNGFEFTQKSKKIMDDVVYLPVRKLISFFKPCFRNSS